jgi:hypothetical protein
MGWQKTSGYNAGAGADAGTVHLITLQLAVGSWTGRALLQEVDDADRVRAPLRIARHPRRPRRDVSQLRSARAC